MRTLYKEPLFIDRSNFAEYIYTIRGRSTANRLYRLIQDTNSIPYDRPLTVEQVADYFDLSKERIMRQLGYDPEQQK